MDERQFKILRDGIYSVFAIVITTFLLLIVLAALEETCKGQSLPVSQGAAMASSALDTASSWGGYELNPALGRGQFGMRQTAIKNSLTAGLLVAEVPLIRRYPRTKRAFIIANWAAAAIWTGAAIRNWRTR